MPKALNLIGQKFNHWTVIKKIGKNKFGQTLWLCECDCENKTQREMTSSNLKSEKRERCIKCKDIKNLKGQIFERWKVISDPIKINERIYFECQCSCDNKTIKKVRADNLLDGTSKSCGCFKDENLIKHNMSHDRIFKIWDGMIRRCYDPNNTRYEDYGGRGIKICNEWLTEENYQGLNNFVKWSLKNGYEDNLTIERIDVNGNYCPENCTWITMKEQANNKRNTIYIEINGVTKTICDWSRDTNINRETLLHRWQNGITGENLLSEDRLNEAEKQSGIKDIVWHKRNKAWEVRTVENGKRKYIGQRKTLEAAKKLKQKYEQNKNNKDGEVN